VHWTLPLAVAAVHLSQAVAEVVALPSSVAEEAAAALLLAAVGQVVVGPEAAVAPP